MNQWLHNWGAGGNHPTKLSASRVLMYAGALFYVLTALYALLAGMILPPDATETGFWVFHGTFAGAEKAANLVFDKMWILFGPYVFSAGRDAAERVAKARNGSK